MTDQRRMTRNALKCLGCGDVIESTHRHDFRSCSCDRVFVDGGLAYQRIGWKGDDGPGYENLAEFA